MKTPNFITNKYFKYSLLVIAGLLLGWLLFHTSGNDTNKANGAIHEHSETENAIWTCSMHPQIKMDKPGACPICGMDLIPLKISSAEIDDAAIEMSESALKLAEVQTSIVTKGGTMKELQLYGKIQPNEKMLQSQTAHVPGRIEKLYVNVTGESIQKGQLIASIYSPELITAQKELLEAVSLSDKYPAILESAREKLRNWKLTDKQIKTLETSSKVTTTFNIYATSSGIIKELKVNEGDYISKGTVLFEVVNLSNVWAVFDAYETDLPWVSMDQKVDFTTQAIPGKVFTGTVSFVDPIIDPATRTARVRVEIANAGLQLKPGFFVNGTLKTINKNADNQLTVPQSAVLWTGVRSVVYVKMHGAEHPTFKMREVTLGASMKDAYVILEGLAVGDEIVTNGAFSIDAAAQLEGKPSMMNRDAEKIAKPHDMSKMNTTDNSSKTNEQSSVKTNEAHVIIKVSGECEMCKARIEKAAKSVVGVKTAVWDSSTKMLHTQFDSKKTNNDAIQKAIAAVGHDTEKYKANAEVYNKLPSCCLYRK